MEIPGLPLRFLEATLVSFKLQLLTVVIFLVNHQFLASFPVSHSSILLMCAGNNSQINYIHSNSCLLIFFWAIENKS